MCGYIYIYITIDIIYIYIYLYREREKERDREKQREIVISAYVARSILRCLMLGAMGASSSETLYTGKKWIMCKYFQQGACQKGIESTQ